MNQSQAICSIIISFTTLFVLISGQPQEVNVTDLIPSWYNRQMRPGNSLTRRTLNVSVSIYINDLTDASNKDAAITVDLILIQKWRDHRLNTSAIGRNRHFIVTQDSVVQLFWRPETYFVNGLDASVVSALLPVQTLTITSDGTLSLAQRVNARLNCDMNLQNFPMDYQYCDIILSQLIYNRSEVFLSWHKLEAHSGSYNLFKMTYWWTTPQCEEEHGAIPGNSCIFGTLKLVRRLQYYIIRNYLLSFLTVAISIVNFWVPVNAWPAKATLLVMPILNLVTQDISVNNSIGVFYTTSFHWWMIGLQCIIYLQLVAWAVAISHANFVADKQHYRKMRDLAIKNGDPVDPDTIILEGYYFGNKNWYAKLGEYVERFNYFFFGYIDYQLDPYSRNKFDYAMRIVFPFFFVFYTFLYTCITVIYWSAIYY